MISAELADLRQGLTVLLASAPMTGLTAQIRVLLVRVHGTRAAPSEQAPQQATAASGALVGGFRGKIDVGDQHRIGVQNRSPIPVAGDRCDQRTLGGEDLLEELFGTPTSGGRAPSAISLALVFRPGAPYRLRVIAAISAPAGEMVSSRSSSGRRRSG